MKPELLGQEVPVTLDGGDQIATAWVEDEGQTVRINFADRPYDPEIWNSGRVYVIREETVDFVYPSEVTEHQLGEEDGTP